MTIHKYLTENLEKFEVIDTDHALKDCAMRVK
jgi:hypothetical protein